MGFLADVLTPTDVREECFWQFRVDIFRTRIERDSIAKAGSSPLDDSMKSSEHAEPSVLNASE